MKYTWYLYVISLLIIHFYILYVFFWVITRRLNFICRRFGTLCLFHLHKLVGVGVGVHLPPYEDGTDRVFRK